MSVRTCVMFLWTVPLCPLDHRRTSLSVWLRPMDLPQLTWHTSLWSLQNPWYTVMLTFLTSQMRTPLLVCHSINMSKVLHCNCAYFSGQGLLNCFSGLPFILPSGVPASLWQRWPHLCQWMPVGQGGLHQPQFEVDLAGLWRVPNSSGVWSQWRPT